MEHLLANLQTKERSINFTKSETDRLQTLLEKYKNIIFCKKTDGVSSKQKDSAWSQIEREFNALADTPRTVKQLKLKFENLKRTAKKEASKERQEMRRTAGGPPPTPPSPGLGDATDWIRGMMPSSIDGNDAVFDDDVIDRKPVFPAKPLQKIVFTEDMNQESKVLKKPGKHLEYSIEIVEDLMTERGEKIPDKEPPTDDDEANAPKEAWNFDARTPHSSLKRPMSTPLKRLANTRTTVDANNVRHLLRQKKLSVMDNLQELELQRIKDSIKHAQELHDQTLRHREERHELEIEKLKLDIIILKKNCRFRLKFV